MSENDASGTFWEHLDVLRGVLLRSLAVVALLAVVAFCFKETLFAVVLAPRSSDFITFRLLGTEPFAVSLMNTGLTEQFMIHMKVAAYAGLLFASPYIIYELFRFVSPALYRVERKRTVQVVGASVTMFLLGTLVNYFLIFPLTVRFLGTYQVSADVTNMLTLQSYMDTLIGMSLVMGVVFELPVVSWMLSRFGILDGKVMRQYRRHAVVAILAVSAIITPTADAFTMLIVALPIWLLYEVSILIVRKGHATPIE
ncbi:twin-arginine translocase subunit TatC [Prevotella sp. Rep29]|uniref:twin-arginine translocase subunit TatC n=1 Tax=Prevotella sp. Rep29 TaxID=2691580 RepID=UPI001C6E23B0|nr:twin-arginine translocase subunit TatC [Prevotella sp. Rep29]MBR3389591.1 twin-arginine translocase subunit TatC [Prevotella sp.]MBR7013751.1 twin-arginine translocase subunit TatC [Prevotella sp.]QYR09773.1 twin-arginine translocase subunit TatC [Prevotella sp. Rep29]